MINKKSIEDKLVVLNEDIVKVQEKLRTLEQQRIETVGILNALQGAKQQCQSFLNELNNEEPDASDSGDVDK